MPITHCSKSYPSCPPSPHPPFLLFPRSLASSELSTMWTNNMQSTTSNEPECGIPFPSSQPIGQEQAYNEKNRAYISVQRHPIRDPPHPVQRMPMRDPTHPQVSHQNAIPQSYVTAGYGGPLPSPSLANDENVASNAPYQPRPPSWLPLTPGVRKQTPRRISGERAKNANNGSIFRCNREGGQATGMPSTQTRGSGFGQAEVDCLLGFLHQHLPLCNDEWEFILVEPNHLFLLHNWTVDGLRRKFPSLHRKTNPTGDPLIPADVRPAKHIR